MKTITCKNKTAVINPNFIVDIVKFNDKENSNLVFINMLNRSYKIKTDKPNSLIEYLQNDSNVEFVVDNII